MAISINVTNSFKFFKNCSIEQVGRKNEKKQKKISWLEMIPNEECTVNKAGVKPLAAFKDV
jgi:hypothetical protein